MNRLIEAVADRIDAAALKKYKGSVHTSQGEIGTIVSVNVFKGTVLINTEKGKVTRRGRQVADLDIYLAPARKK